MTEPAEEPRADDNVVDLEQHRGGDVEQATGRMMVGGISIDRGLLARTICHDLTDDELDLFIATCNRTGLDPFAKQIYAIKRNDRNAPGGKKLGIQTSIDGFRLIAERSGKYAGQTPIEWLGGDKIWVDVWLDDVPPLAARVGVYKAGFAEPLVRTATWSQYAQMTNDKPPKPTPMWQKMPALMLGKCAEALALRAAFPAELSGLYTDDEMMQAESASYAGPRGTGQRSIPAASQEAGTLADPDVLVDLQLRVIGLPDDARADLAQQWQKVDKLRGYRLASLGVERVRIAESLIRGAETAASKSHAEWSPDAAIVTTRERLGRAVVRVLSLDSLDVSPDTPTSAESDATASDDAATQTASDSGSESATDAERAKQVAADLGMQPAASLLDQQPAATSDLPPIGDDVVYPLTTPPAVDDPDDAEFLHDVPTPLVDHVIEAVRALKVGDVNKALRAHDVRPTTTMGDDARRARLTLAILRLLLA